MRATHPNSTLSQCSLLDLRAGARAVVLGFDRDVAPGLARRLVSMGLPIGAETEVLVRRGKGPMLLRAHDARIALGRDEARAVRVECLRTETP